VAFLLGLTGNIACGKSTVGQLLAERFGADYIDADRVVHTLYAAGSPETEAIARRFGHDLLTPDGTIDRRKLGDRVVIDPQALRMLEDILQPGVRRAIEQRIEQSQSPVVVLDAIRLIEAGLAERCDAVWVVTCDPNLQLVRLQQSRGFTVEQAQRRITSQRSQEEKAKHATSVIDNRGGLLELEEATTQAWLKDVQPYLVQSSPP
jgi:dephospho-CoA kinase